MISGNAQIRDRGYRKVGKKVLLIDGGGRGHALAWKLHQSRDTGDLFIAPGNAGTAQVGVNVPIDAKDMEGLLNFVLKNAIGFTVVGQDDPLAMGIVDEFQDRGLRIFGPMKLAAMIESSKVFSKQLMRSEGIPTTKFETIANAKAAQWLANKHFKRRKKPLVIKANGLALGKGSYVCYSLAEAEAAIDELLIKRIHGAAGQMVVVEDFADGEEISAHSFCDGSSSSLFPAAQDHKAVFDGDVGPNTGGMGVAAPVPWFTDHHKEYVTERVVNPTLRALARKRTPFVGILYPGLKGRNVLEFNARFGDPEAQVYMSLLKSDLLEILEACVDGRLSEMKIEWHRGYAVCVVLASERYPSPNYKKGVSITGVEAAERLPGVRVFHAGTKLVNNELVTSGGRVLGVTGTGETLQDAIYRAYDGVRCIHFDGMHYRTDIGWKLLRM